MDFIIMEGDFPFWRGFLVERWKRLPHRTLLLTRAPGLWRPSDWDRLAPLPMAAGRLDLAGLAREARSFGSIAGACTIFEPAVGLTLEVQRALALPQLSEGDPRTLRNKAAMVELARGAGFAVPRTVHGADADAVVRDALRTLAFPMVCKPPELAGKAGVRLVRTEAELREAASAAIAETLPFEIDGRPTSVVDIFSCERGVLVQEFVDGPEVSVEGWATCGEPVVLDVTEKLHSGPPLFEELGHVQPAGLDAAARRQVVEYAKDMVRAFRLAHCAFHLEVRVTRSGPVLMEINCRIGGDMIARLLELRSTLDSADALLRLAAGARVEAPPRFVGAAGIRMVTSATGGRVASLAPPALRSDGEFAVFEAGVGSPVHAPKAGGVTRLGYLMVAAAEPEAVRARLDELAAETRVEVEDAPAASA